MTEATITCPECKSEIPLSESLAAPLIAATRRQFEQQIAQKDEDIAKREQGLREKEKQVTDARRTLDEQVADQVAAQLKAERTHSRQETLSARRRWRGSVEFRDSRFPKVRTCLSTALDFHLGGARSRRKRWLYFLSVDACYAGRYRIDIKRSRCLDNKIDCREMHYSSQLNLEICSPISAYVAFD